MTKVLWLFNMVLVTSAFLFVHQEVALAVGQNDASIKSKVLQINDLEVADRISRKLFNSKNFSPETIHINFKNGIVTLTGDVSSLRAKNRAVQYAEGTRGVLSVVDELKIKASKRSDEQIEKGVMKLLSLNPTTHSFKIDSQVRRGVVTLNGKVDSWAERDMATWVTEGIKGVLSVKNEIRIVPQRQFTDEEIRQEIIDRLKEDSFLDDKVIGVNVKDSEVTLTGSVPSLTQGRSVYNAALVPGVMSVDAKDIKIDPTIYNWGPATKFPEDDVQIQTAATRALKNDLRLRNSSVHVDVNGQIATISGQVENLKIQSLVREDVEGTVGVRAVQDELVVKSRQSRSDQDILADTNDVLGMDSLLGPFPITPHVKEGVVTLEGKVDTEYEKWDAGDEVALVDGVKGLRNELGLYRPRQKFAAVSDSVIKNTVSRDLREDPKLNSRDQFDVVVKNGKVTLTGSARNWLDSFEAAGDAFEGGATGVSNQIRIAGQKEAQIQEYSGIPAEVYAYQRKPSVEERASNNDVLLAGWGARHKVKKSAVK